jgi:hypothetical protein
MPLEVRSVFKIAGADDRVREHLERQGWESRGKDEEMEMDSYRNRRTGKLVCVEDISDDFPVTFLIGELGLEEFERMARHLTPELKPMEVESSWEGKPTKIAVAMSVSQVKSMFGRRAKMRPL